MRGIQQSILAKVGKDKEKPGVRKTDSRYFSVISDYLDSETLVELPTLEPDVVLLPQAVAIAATIATTATKAKIFFMSLISLQ